MTCCFQQPRASIDACSVEQALLLRGFSKAEFAHEISVTRQAYNRYLDEGFSAKFQATLNNALTISVKFLTTPHLRVLETSNINFLAGKKATAVHREAAVANRNLLIQIDSWIRTTYTVPSLDRVDQ